jgi:molybdopterin converting factor small subunit
MTITVELFGIPRERAGTERVQCAPARLGDVLAHLLARFPRLADECIAGDRLQSGYLANLNGQKFVTDPATELTDGDSLLILSADAGG